MDKKDIDRFWSKVDIKGKDNCWIWLGTIGQHGYGEFSTNGQTNRAHRVSYRINHGYPYGNVLHKCDNKLCVNPNHLFLGSQSDNVSDMFSKDRQANLKGENNSGSKLTESNVLEIIKLSNLGKADTEIAQLFNVSRSAIWGITSGKYWKHIQRRWNCTLVQYYVIVSA